MKDAFRPSMTEGEADSQETHRRGPAAEEKSRRVVDDFESLDPSSPRYQQHLERMARKAQVEKRRKTLKWIGIAAVVMGLIYVAPIPLGSLTVTGSKTVTLEDVKAAANLSDPVNILRVSSSKLKERLSHDLRVADVDVSYVFPLTMQVNITDRTPVMILPAQFGYLIIDRKGQVIEATEALHGIKAPIVSGVGASNLLLGDQVADDTMKAAVTYLDALPAQDLAQLEEINVGDPNQLLAYTVDGVQIRLGDTSRLQEKADLTVSMLKDLQDKHVRAQFIDVNLDAPYIKEIK